MKSSKSRRFRCTESQKVQTHEKQIENENRIHHDHQRTGCEEGIDDKSPESVQTEEARDAKAGNTPKYSSTPQTSPCYTIAVIMGGQVKKATKKFQKKHLKDVLERRNELKKKQQRYQVKAKKKAQKVDDYGKVDDTEKSNQKSKDGKSDFKDMTVDEFFPRRI